MTQGIMFALVLTLTVPVIACFGGDVVIPGSIEGHPVVAVIYGSGAGFGDGSEYYDFKLNRPLSAAEIRAKGLRPAVKSIVFPGSITEIRQAGDYSGHFFNFNLYLTGITFPKNLKTIPVSFASNVTSLTSITWPEKLEEIGGAGEFDAGCFGGSGITELVLPEGLKVIGTAAFRGCKKLTSVTIPNSVETIGNRAFADCPELTSVTIPRRSIDYPGSDYSGAF